MAGVLGRVLDLERVMEAGVVRVLFLPLRLRQALGGEVDTGEAIRVVLFAADVVVDVVVVIFLVIGNGTETATSIGRTVEFHLPGVVEILHLPEGEDGETGDGEGGVGIHAPVHHRRRGDAISDSPLPLCLPCQGTRWMSLTLCFMAHLVTYALHKIMAVVFCKYVRVSRPHQFSF
jgi:hypothetical protein